MTRLTILTFILAAVIAIASLFLNKPTKPLLTAFLIFLIIVSGIVGIVSTVIDAKSKKRQQDKAATQIEELIDGKNKLLELNTKLSGEIETYQQDLREKEEKIKELDKKAKMSERGITSIYTFNGNRRENTAGSMTLSSGPEGEIFKQMVDLEKSKSYPALIKLCKQQIKKTPDWYTLYFYLGVAQANMDLKDDAIKNIQYCVDNTPGDLEYAEAREILERLKQQP